MHIFKCVYTCVYTPTYVCKWMEGLGLGFRFRVHVNGGRHTCEHIYVLTRRHTNMFFIKTCYLFFYLYHPPVEDVSLMRDVEHLRTNKKNDKKHVQTKQQIKKKLDVEHLRTCMYVVCFTGV